MRVQVTRRAKIKHKAKSEPEPIPEKIEREQYEYQSRIMDADADLTAFGKDGWICYSVVRSDPNDASSKKATFYFRRKK